MNRRQAKRLACELAGLVISNTLAAGWELDEWVDGDAADRDRLEAELLVLSNELLRRGAR